MSIFPLTLILEVVNVVTPTAPVIPIGLSLERLLVPVTHLVLLLAPALRMRDDAHQVGLVTEVPRFISLTIMLL